MFSSAAGSGMLPNHLCWGELDGPSNSHTSGPLGPGMPMSGDLIGADILPLHLRGGEPRSLPGHLCVEVPLGPGQLQMGKTTNLGGFSSHLRMGEMAGLGHLPSHLHMGDPIGGGSFPSHMRVGEPGFGGSFPMQGFQGSIKADTETFYQSRKRRPGRMGWCRICIIDCETVEGLDLHSQTREHQKMAMQMVLSIRQDNAKKYKNYILKIIHEKMQTSRRRLVLSVVVVGINTFMFHYCNKCGTVDTGGVELTLAWIHVPFFNLQ